MGEAAVAAARAVGYANAGTIEFLFQSGEFFFLEMNTRIQVEHPVTELVTGLDLVQWQIRIASGERLPFSQSDIMLSGHALECRITSEDPANGFLPSTGRITHLEVPAGPGIRWDGGVLEGGEISLFYDPLIGKLIVHAQDREAAVARMQRAIAELRVVGVETSTPFHAAVLAEADFRSGEFDIHYVDKHPAVLAPDIPDDALRAAALAAALLEDQHRQRGSLKRAGSSNPAATAPSAWRDTGWRR
jgi:acetyl-CoA carboxylase biotin carboxylase subunit